MHKKSFFGSLRHSCSLDICSHGKLLLHRYGWFPATFLSSSCSFRRVCARIQSSEFVCWRHESNLHLLRCKMTIITQQGYYQLTSCFHWDSAQQRLLFEPVRSVTFIMWLCDSQKSLVSPLSLWQDCFWQLAPVWEVKWHWFHHPHPPPYLCFVSMLSSIPVKTVFLTWRQHNLGRFI